MNLDNASRSRQTPFLAHNATRFCCRSGCTWLFGETVTALCVCSHQPLLILLVCIPSSQRHTPCLHPDESFHTYFLVPLVLIPLRIMNSTDILICTTNILLLIRWWLEQTLTANRDPAFTCLLFAIFWSVSCRWAGAGRHVWQVEACVSCCLSGLRLLHKTCPLLATHGPYQQL
jgi:hypothetical protein